MVPAVRIGKRLAGGEKDLADARLDFVMDAVGRAAARRFNAKRLAPMATSRCDQFLELKSLLLLVLLRVALLANFPVRRRLLATFVLAGFSSFNCCRAARLLIVIGAEQAGAGRQGEGADRNGEQSHWLHVGPL